VVVGPEGPSWPIGLADRCVKRAGGGSGPGPAMAPQGLESSKGQWAKETHRQEAGVPTAAYWAPHSREAWGGPLELVSRAMAWPLVVKADGSGGRQRGSPWPTALATTPAGH